MSLVQAEDLHQERTRPGVFHPHLRIDAEEDPHTEVDDEVEVGGASFLKTKERSKAWEFLEGMSFAVLLKK